MGFRWFRFVYFFFTKDSLFSILDSAMNDGPALLPAPVLS